MQYPTLKRNTNFLTKRDRSKRNSYSTASTILKNLLRLNKNKTLSNQCPKTNSEKNSKNLENPRRNGNRNKQTRQSKKKKCSTPPSPLIGQIKIAIFATTERVTQAHDEWNPRISNSSRHGGRQFTVGTRPKRIVARSSDVSLTQDARQDERSPICLPAVCQLARDSIQSRAKSGRERERVIHRFELIWSNSRSPFSTFFRWLIEVQESCRERKILRFLESYCC